MAGFMGFWANANIEGLECSFFLQGSSVSLFYCDSELPAYEGDIEGLKAYDTKAFQYLLDNNIIKET
jgi:hypothetical protein